MHEKLFDVQPVIEKTIHCLPACGWSRYRSHPIRHEKCTVADDRTEVRGFMFYVYDNGGMKPRTTAWDSMIRLVSSITIFFLFARPVGISFHRKMRIWIRQLNLNSVFNNFSRYPFSKYRQVIFLDVSLATIFADIPRSSRPTQTKPINENEIEDEESFHNPFIGRFSNAPIFFFHFLRHPTTFLCWAVFKKLVKLREISRH